MLFLSSGIAELHDVFGRQVAFDINHSSLVSIRITNEVITLVKDTSLAFALAYTEMFTLAKQVAASTASIMPLFIAGLFYYIFNFLVAMVMEKLEKRMQYFD